MIQTVEAVVDEEGTVHLLSHLQVAGPRRAFVMVVEESATVPSESALLSEPSLAEDWNRPEEDTAWAPLQPET